MSRSRSWLRRAIITVVPLASVVVPLGPAVGAAAATGAPASPATASSTEVRTAVSGTQIGAGYRVVNSAGKVRTFGGLAQDGDLSGVPLASPVVGIAAVPGGRGYWMVAADGGVFTYGGAGFFGSAGGLPLVRPIVGMASTPSGRGYWLVASDGGIFAYGDAAFYGSTGGIALNKPIVGMSSTPTGRGYWLVASDGGIFAFGDAAFYGSTGGIRLVQPIVGMAATRDGFGYRMVAADGGIFSFGNAPFLGSAVGKLGTRVVGMTTAGLVLPPGDYGYDISWPQCTSAGASTTVTPSQRREFAIIGTTRAKTFTPNTCLAAQWSWATAAGHPAMVYMNVDPPAPGAASGDNGPAGPCPSGDMLCRAYNHGFNAAGYAWDYAASQGVSADLWWLDVEVASFSDPARNAWKDARGEIAQRSIAGVRDGLRARGASVGIYSTPYQWRYITTTGDPNTPGQGWIADVANVWTAGGPSDNLPSYCSAEKSFAGGQVAIVQGRGGTYIDPANGREYDFNYACVT